MSLEMVKNLMKEVGWGFLATSDGNKVGVRPMGSCVWMDNELWCATIDGTEKILQLRKIPYAGYKIMLGFKGSSPVHPAISFL